VSAAVANRTDGTLATASPMPLTSHSQKPATSARGWTKGRQWPHDRPCRRPCARSSQHRHLRKRSRRAGAAARVRTRHRRRTGDRGAETAN